MTNEIITKETENEYTEEERKFLEMLFKIGDNIIDAQDGYMDFDGTSFSSNDAFKLKDKLGLVEW